jgi:DNA gyrase subunit A
MAIVRPGGAVLTVTEHGYGKRTELDEYRVQSRGGVGIISTRTSVRNGRVAGVEFVEDEDELMLITQGGKVLRMDTKDIRMIGRATQGVRLIEIDDDDRVVSFARLRDEVENGTEADFGSEPAAEDL